MGNIQKIFKLDFIIFALVSLVLWVILTNLVGIKILDHSPIDQFTQQAIMWQKGLNYLPKDDPSLELALFNNRIYVSFPPAPTFIEYPFTLIFGQQTPNTFVLLLLTWIAMLFTFCIFLKLTDNRLLSFAAAFIFFWGTQILYLSLIGRVWHQGQLFGMVFGVTAILIAVYSKKAYPLLFAGFMVSLAVGCRPFYLFLAIVIFYIAIRNQINWKKAFLFICAGMLPLGVFYALYNYARFGAFLEFGHNYLPHIINDKIRQFGPEFLQRNAFHAFLKMPQYDDVNQYMHFSGLGTAFWVVSPYMLLAFFFFFKKDIPIYGKILCGIALSIIWLSLLMHESNGWFQFGYRYGVDLIAILIYFFAVSFKRLTIWMVILGAYSVVINIYGAFWFYVIH